MSSEDQLCRGPDTRRKSRWGPEAKASKSPSLQTAITAAMTPEQLDAYVTHLRIEEINQELLTQDLEPHESGSRRRSLSPPPEYNVCGRRINTRQHRRRRRLEQERSRLVTTASKIFGQYHAPRNAPANLSSELIKEKVYLPVRDFPGLNFIGQILGPRGNSLRQMIDESKANIAIRGKGSVKEGRGRSRTTTAAADHLPEPLHCLITADDQRKLDTAKELIDRVIETVVSTPEDQNTRKREQLRQLATINGTFRDDERQTCLNCGQHGHRQYTCAEPKKQAGGVKCHLCHNNGHIARDCLQRKGTGNIPPWRRDRITGGSKVLCATESELEFEMLMEEIAN